VINIEHFRLNVLPKIPVGKHTHDCLHYEGGPCTCGLEEVLEDEALESTPEES
jgi:hypothetical protein